MLAPHEHTAFDVYFASLATMRVHPGAGTKGHEAPTLEECRDMALDMIRIRRDVLRKED